MATTECEEGAAAATGEAAAPTPAAPAPPLPAVAGGDVHTHGGRAWEPERLSGPVGCVYNVVLFFAYWFRANRFEFVDGHSDEKQDVDAYLHDIGVRGQGTSVLETMKKQKLSRNRSNEENNRPRAPTDGSDAPPEGGASTQDEGQTMQDHNSLGGVIEDLEDVEVHAEELVSVIARMQKVPWFVILQGLFIFFLWLFAAIVKEKEDCPDLSGTYVSSADSTEMTLNQVGCFGDNIGQWDYTVSGTKAELHDGRGVTGTISGAKGERTIEWTDGITFTQTKAYGANYWERRAGFDDIFGGGFSSGPTDLRVHGSECEDYRAQAYRWFTYQWTHISATHVIISVFMLIFFGIPLEGLFGFCKVMLLNQLGVLSGALCYFWLDAYTPVVGASGGIYAFIGVHVADLVLEGKTKKFKLFTPIFIAALAALDIGSYLLTIQREYTSCAPHLGGFLVGLLVGMAYYSKKRAFKGVFLAVAFVCVVFGFVWLAITFPGTNMLQIINGEPGYCWTRQFWDPVVTGDEYNWYCIRCSSPECVAKWSQTAHIKHVNPLQCTKESIWCTGADC